MRKELSRKGLTDNPTDNWPKEMMEYKTIFSIREDSTLNTKTRKLKYTAIVIKYFSNILLFRQVLETG